MSEGMVDIRNAVKGVILTVAGVNETEDPDINQILFDISMESKQSLLLVNTLEDEFEMEFEDDDIDFEFFSDFELLYERLTKNLASASKMT